MKCQEISSSWSFMALNRKNQHYVPLPQSRRTLSLLGLPGAFRFSWILLSPPLCPPLVPGQGCCVSTRLYRRWPMPPHTHRRSSGMSPALQVTSAQRHAPQSPVTPQWCVSHLLCPLLDRQYTIDDVSWWSTPTCSISPDSKVG